jgi:hypothetical protein
MVTQVTECVDRAHEVEATIAYDACDVADPTAIPPATSPSIPAATRRVAAAGGLSL